MGELDPDLRAADADRERTAGALQEHYAQGRLDGDELKERLDAVYRARTLGDLAPVTRDLPAQDLNRLPAPVRPAPARRSALRHPAVVVPWTIWGAASAVNLVVWAMVTAGADGAVHPWWIWVAGPAGAVLLCVTVALLLLGVLDDKDR